MTITPCSIAHLEEVRAIYNHYVLHSTATFRERPFTAEEIREKYDSLLRQSYPFLVALDGDGKVAGFCHAGPFRAGSAYRLAEITVYLAPGRTGGGLGGRLYRALFSELEKKPEVFALMAVITAENTDSIAFHRRFGFEDAGRWRQAGCKLGRLLDVRCFQLLRPFLKEISQ